MFRDKFRPEPGLFFICYRMTDSFDVIGKVFAIITKFKENPADESLQGNFLLLMNHYKVIFSLLMNHYKVFFSTNESLQGKFFYW